MPAAAIHVVRLGRIDYLECWQLQRALASARRLQQVPDLLLLLEHPPTYTVGRGGKRSNLLLDDATLQALGARFYAVDRGGDMTFHGPGQLVAYVILELGREQRSVRRFVERLERAVIDALGHFGVEATIDPARPGVWVGRDKIAAIGIAVSRGVTYHGFALNVDPDLRYFEYMIPCGIPDRGVTSLAKLLGVPVSLAEVEPEVVRSFSRAFGREVVEGLTVTDLTGFVGELTAPGHAGLTPGQAPAGRRSTGIAR